MADRVEHLFAPFWGMYFLGAAIGGTVVVPVVFTLGGRGMGYYAGEDLVALIGLVVTTLTLGVLYAGVPRLRRRVGLAFAVGLLSVLPTITLLHVVLT